MKHDSGILTGIHKKWAYAKIWSGILLQLSRKYPNPLLLSKIVRRIKRTHARSGVNKISKLGDKYFLSPNFQSIPSPQFYNFVFQQVNRVLGKELVPSEQLVLGILSITKKCPLNCEHCCESAILNQKEVLSEENLISIVEKLQRAGVANFIFGGGEPMVRVKGLLKVLNQAKHNADFWIMTSGFNLSQENARKLKMAGLTGIIVSLDHYEKKSHNNFRRDKRAYDWAINAINHAQKEGLATALTICVTRNFCTRENLMKYMDLAIKLNVPFVQILEPSAVGNYKGKDVLLEAEHISILDKFYLDMKEDSKFAGYPIVLYHGYENRRVGCLSSGIRNLYIDTDGMVHNCPMCRKTSGNILNQDIQEIIENTKKVGCSKFATFDIS